jgi:hypothetical protein
MAAVANRLFGGRTGLDPQVWFPAAEPDPAAHIPELAAVPYLSGYEPASASRGVTVRKAGAYPGLLLYLSGHAPAAYLTTLDGRALHTWQHTAPPAWRDAFQRENDGQEHFWRQVLLLDDGAILAIFQGIGLVKLDRQSRLLWGYQGATHHQVAVDEDGTLLVLTQKRTLVRDVAEPLLEDFLTRLDPDGRVVKEISILQCFRNSPFASHLERLQESGDVFHTNSVRILDGRLASRTSAFQKGNVLVSINKLGVVAVVDPRRESVVWALSGLWWRQHDPSLLSDGSLLLFDNGGNLRKDRSRVIEIDPLLQQIRWTYEGEPSRPLFSASNGAVRRLPNGNTLVVESNRGRAIEVTPGGEIVWEFYNPHRAGARNQLVATLFQVERIEASHAAWAAGKLPAR